MYNYKTIQVVDPIWLEDSLKRIPSSSKKIIALFDIPVLKEYLRILMDENFENRYTFKTVFKFILDVIHNKLTFINCIFFDIII